MAQEKNLTQSQKDGNPSQVPYYSATEACDSLGTVVPASMAYNQKQFANKLKVAIKPSVHEFVMNRLKYDNYDEFCKSFGREQIDAIANAIYNFENTGFGIIIADQTGVGKGRIGAGLIRYAIEHLGKMPVFVTDKPHLINDMYRDLIDISYQANVPEQVKVQSFESTDLTDSELEKYILKDLDDSEMLRVDISEFINDPDFNPYNLFVRGKSRDDLDSRTMEIIDQTGLDIDGIREFIKDEYRNYIAINGTEVYQSDWIVTKDENYGLANAEIGDNYKSLLKKELNKGKKIVKPFIIGNSIKIKDDNGNLLFDAKSDKGAIATKRISSEYKVLMTPYSQFSRAFDKVTLEPSDKFDLVRRIVANDGVLILDESHKASGMDEKGNSSNTGRAVQDLISLAKNVIYISATYAKEPKNMTLYSEKTAIREAQLNYAELNTAFTKGGVALQEATASELSSVGHLVRRERPIVGKTEYLYTNIESEIGKSQVDAFERFRGAMNAIKDFQQEVFDMYKEEIHAIAGGDAEEKARLKKEYPYAGNITVLSFNTIQSFLLGLKVEQTVDVAINHLRSGKKPIIAVANTMESIFDNVKKDYVQDIGYDLNDYIEDDLGLVFGYLVDYCLKIKQRRTIVKIVDGKSVEEDVYDERHIFKNCPSDLIGLRDMVRSKYLQFLQAYKSYKVYLPLSPIDRIVSRIKEKGFTLNEITRRKRKLVYDKNNPALAKLEKRKEVNVTDAIKEFNQNKIDCLVLNRSGAVGVSMHSKPNAVVDKFDKSILKIENIDNRPYPKSLEPRDEVKARVMIITQMETDIYNEIQKLGRISRTGQIYAPEYNYIFSCLPLEKRFASMMERKMRSLMANVSAEQTQGASQFSFDDLLSKTGGECVISPAFGIGITIPKEFLKNPNEDTVNFVLKQLYWKSVQSQEQFYTNFLRDFQEKLSEKIANGTYTEKVLIKNYGARTIDVLPISLGMENPFSSFGFPVFAELMDIEIFQDRNFAQAIADKIGKKMLTLPDSNGNQVPIEDMDNFKAYLKNINDQYFEKSIKTKYNDLIDSAYKNIEQAEAEINNLKSAMIGYEDFEKAEGIVTSISTLENESKQLAEGMTNLYLAGNQDEINLASALIQQKQKEIQDLKAIFDEKYKEIFEKRDEFRESLKTIKSLNTSIEKNKEGLVRTNQRLVEQESQHDAFNYYVDRIGHIFNIKSYQENVVDTFDENGVVILDLRKYDYATISDENCVLTSIEYPFQERSELDYTYGNIKLYFTTAFGGGNLIRTLASFYEPMSEFDLLQGKKQLYDVIDTEKFYVDSWDKYVLSVYNGERQEKVFLTGSHLKAINYAKTNNITGSFVKFSTNQNTERIGYELTQSASDGLAKQFNNSQDFPLSININRTIVEGSIYYKFNQIIESLNYGISPSDSPYYDNSYNGNFLSFELTDKTTTDVKDASTTLKDLALLELRCNPNEVNRVRNEVKTLNDFIDSNSLYFRIATTNEDYILELINICKSLNLKKSGEYNSYFSLGDFRAFRYLSKQGDKPFALKNKNRVSDFSNNMDYSEIRTIKMKSIGYTRYDYIVQNNIFINSPTLNYEVTKNNIYIESWYNMKFGLDLHIQDFLTLMDYLNQQGMAMKSVLSYGLLKDSGNFVFDMDSYQRAFTVVEADGEGVVVSDLGEEQEATIDQRIEDLIELFKI